MAVNPTWFTGSPSRAPGFALKHKFASQNKPDVTNGIKARGDLAQCLGASQARVT